LRDELLLLLKKEAFVDTGMDDGLVMSSLIRRDALEPSMASISPQFKRDECRYGTRSHVHTFADRSIDLGSLAV